MRIKAKSEQKLLTSDNQVQKIEWKDKGEKKTATNKTTMTMTTTTAVDCEDKWRKKKETQTPHTYRTRTTRELAKYQFETVAFYGKWKS